MITVRNLDFEYNGKKALHDVSVTIPAGSVTALVGPNGAGKTTLMRCMAGLDKPVAGDITIDGVDVLDDPRAAHRMCGYLSDFFGLYDALTVRQCLTYMAWCQNIPADRIEARIAALAAQLHITPLLDVAAGTLSRGNRQRLGIALALVHDPKILILDEPASGMDPEARTRLSHMMLSLKAAGKTIIVSSHILNELEDYCTDMLVIRDGRVSDHVVLRDYQAVSRTPVEITLAAPAPKAAALLAAMKGVEDVGGEGLSLHFTVLHDPIRHQAILRQLVMADVPVAAYHPAGKKLQDAYMELAETPVVSAGDKK